MLQDYSDGPWVFVLFTFWGNLCDKYAIIIVLG